MKNLNIIGFLVILAVVGFFLGEAIQGKIGQDVAQKEKIQSSRYASFLRNARLYRGIMAKDARYTNQDEKVFSPQFQSLEEFGK